MSLPYIIDGETDADSTTINTWIDMMNSTRASADRVDPGSDGTDGQQLRWRLGAPAYVKSKTYYLNDKNDVDPTGADAMGATISTYLDEIYSDDHIREVICDPGSTYKVGADSIVLPANVLFEGGHRYNATSDQQSTIKAVSGATALVEMSGQFGALKGLQLHGNSVPGVTLVKPTNHYLDISECHFTGLPADGVGIKGGGILYFSMDHCLFQGNAGRAIDLLLAYYGGGGTPYYGVNVGQISRSWFYGASPGVIRFDGILTVRDCDIEGSYSGSTGVIEAGAATLGHLTLDATYFEMSGSNANLACVFLANDGATASIVQSIFYGPTGNPAGMAAIRFGGPLARIGISNNEFFRWDTAVADIASSLGGALDISGNYYGNVTTRHTFLAGYDKTRATAGVNSGRGVIADGEGGMAMYGGSIQGSLVRYSHPTNHLVVDLARGNVHEFEYSGSASPTIANARPGMQFICRFVNANATLTNSAWHIAEGSDTAPSAGTSRQFYVDYSSVVRQVGV